MTEQNAAPAATLELALNSEVAFTGRALTDVAEAAAKHIDPEGVARLRFQSIDAVKGNVGMKYKFDIDPDGTYDLESVAGIIDAVIALDDVSLRVPDDQSKVLLAIRTGIWDLLK